MIKSRNMRWMKYAEHVGDKYILILGPKMRREKRVWITGHVLLDVEKAEHEDTG
jgi:hypothetical protein